MPIELDENALLLRLSPRLAAAPCQAGIRNLTDDPFFMAFFLASVSQGEGLGEAAVGMIGHEELAAFIRDLDKQEAEERGHKERTIDVARELFPDQFVDGRYRHPDALMGRSYYVAVLEAIRERLARRGRRSRLNVYLTTTFGYELMVLLLYGAVARALARSTLPSGTRDRIAKVLDGILAEEETHVGVVGQHNALLEAPREGLSKDARRMLDALAELETDDYVFAAELAVARVVEMMSRYAEAADYKAEIQSRGTGETTC